MKGLYKIGSLLLLSIAALWGQTDANPLTVTASRSLAPQPDQVLFWVSVSSPLNTSLDDVVAALASLGITATDLGGVQISEMNSADGKSCVPDLQWTFTLGVPFAKLKDATSNLAALQQKIGQTIPGSTLTFSVIGTGISPQLQAAQQCSVTDLMADARVEAQKLASAAGGSIGPILALTDGSLGFASGIVAARRSLPSQIALVSTVVPAPAGCSTTTTTTVGSTLFTSNAISNPVSCVLVVKFALLRP